MIVIADRTVSARLRADVTGYIAAMRAAQRATRQLQQEMDRTGQGTSGDFEEIRRGAQRLEQALRRVTEAERARAREQQQTSQETQRSTRATEQQRRATDQARDSLGRFTRQVEESTRSQDRQRRSTDQARDTLGRFTSEATRGARATASLAGGLLALGAAGSSAAVALGAFGTLAAPSIYKVVAAQEDLASEWSSLSPLQQAAAVQVQDLKTNYSELAESFEPQAMAAFNTVLRTGSELLPMLADVATETSVDVQRLLDRIGGFATGPQMQGFLDNVSENAPQALDQLGDAAISTGSLALQLATDLTPVGMSLLTVANGALSLVNGLAQVNPAFAQLAVMGLLLRGPLLGIAGGVKNMTGRMRAGREATRGMSKSQKLLHAVTRAGPALYVAAGVGLAFLAVKAMNATDAHDELLESMRIEAGAVGNNLAGHKAYEEQLESTADTLKNKIAYELSHYTAAEQKSADALEDKQDKVSKLRNEYRKTDEQLKEQTKTVQTVIKGADQLADQYNITREEALQLATAAGVDLTQAMGENEKITNDAAAKIKNYRVAVEAAKNPTKSLELALDAASNEALSMKDRVDALSNALNLLFNPSLAVYQTTTQLRQGFRDLAEAAKEAKGSLKGNSEESLLLRQQFAQQLDTVSKLGQAIFRKTGRMKDARAEVEKQLPLLYALAGSNKEAKAQVDALARSFGINTGALRVSKDAFIQQATAMLGSKQRAVQLWEAYQKLRTETNLGSGATGRYITKVKEAANAARIQTLRTDGARGAQTVYNQEIRDALPVLYALAGNNKKARAQVDALAKATGNATGKSRVSRDAFLKQAESMKISRGRAEALWRELQKIPRKTKAQVDINARGYWSNWRSMPGATTGGPAHLVPRAKGGPIPSLGPESSRAYDSVPALLRVDEHVWTPEEVDAVGGHDAMYRLRAMAKAGQLQGYARGGQVALDRGGSTRAVVNDVFRPINRGYAGFITAIVRSMAASWKKYMASGGAALAWARTQVGKPYLWGGVGPAGYDCSGWTSAITNVIQGRSPHQRRHTTHSFGASGGPDGFVRNLSSPFMVGVTDAGVGHMAGTLNGVAVESSGGAGVRVGGGARGASNSLFTRRYGLRMARGGAVGRAEARLARQALQPGASDREVELAATLGLTGDPSSDVSPVRPEIPGYGDGGWVRGRPGRDKALIAATTDEFVVNKAQATKYPGLVEAINSGQLGRSMVSPLRSALPIRITGSASAAASAGRDVAVSVGPVVVQDKADADLIAARVGFAVRGAAF